MIRSAWLVLAAFVVGCAGAGTGPAGSDPGARPAEIGTRGGIEEAPAAESAPPPAAEAEVTSDPLVLDGETSLDYEPGPALDLGSSGTIEFWVAALWSEDPGFFPCVLASRAAYDGEDPAGLAAATRYSVHISGDRQEIGLWNGRYWGSAPFDFRDENLHHVVIVTDGGRSMIVVDGETRGELEIGYGSAAGLPFHVGSSDGESEFFLGAVDGIRLWRAALGSDVIEALSEIDGALPPEHPNARDLVAMSSFTESEHEIVLVGDE